jgi:hypothetical protein
MIYLDAAHDAFVFTASRDRLIKVWHADYKEKKVIKNVLNPYTGRIKSNSG